MSTSPSERGPFFAWQLRLYPDNHTRRTTLLVHAITVPLFWLGLAELIAAPLARLWILAVSGLVNVLIAVVLQGRMHKRETVPPVPFLGPGDAVKRLLLEQLVTFPRFVLSGGFARAWRASA